MVLVLVLERIVLDKYIVHCVAFVQLNCVDTVHFIRFFVKSFRT